MKRFFLSLFLFIIVFSIKVHASPFEDNLLKWLNGIGFDGKINEISKNYDQDGFIDNFYVDLEENLPAARANPNIYAMVTQENGVQEMQLRILKKDIKGIPYLYFDWIAKLAFNLAIKKFGNLLGLVFTLKDMPDGSILAKIDPAKTSVASRYRFDHIVVHYSVNNLILDIDVKIIGPSGYLIAEFLKGELNGVLRSCENGSTPLEDTIFGRTSLVSADSTFSDRLLKEVLKQPPRSEIEKALKNQRL